MNKSRTIAAKLSRNRCPERGSVVLDQPQRLAKAWLSGVFHALRLVFDTAAPLSVPVAAASLLLLCPASAHAQGGVPLWTNRYDGTYGFSGMAVDDNGDVIVGGVVAGSQGTSDFLTIKYSGAGMPLWTNLYNLTNGSGFGLAVGQDGSVFVFGYDAADAAEYVLVKYSTAGIPLWTNQFKFIAQGGSGSIGTYSPNILVGHTGKIFLEGGAAFSSDGVLLWTQDPNLALGAFTLDSSDNVIATGANAAGSGYETVKYSLAGVPLWTNIYVGPTANGYGSAIAVDKNDNVFVTGTSNDSFNPDYATVAYSSSGVPIWTNRYNGPANKGDKAWAVAVDSSGNVFVTGYSEVSSGVCCDYATVAYSPTGTQLWVRRYNGPGNSQDWPHAIAVDNAGNVFVTGESYAANGDIDFATVAYSNTGTPLWTNRYNLSGKSTYVGAMALDRSGNVFLAGASRNGTNYDIVTIKYSSSVQPAVRLDFQLLSSQLVLSWTAAGFNLQTAPAVTGTFTNLPGATSPYTNATTGAQQFFRLRGD